MARKPVGARKQPPSADADDLLRERKKYPTGRAAARAFRGHSSEEDQEERQGTVTYASSIIPRLDTIEHSLEILGKLTPEIKQKLDAARTGPDALETAMSAAIDMLETAS